MIRRIVPLLFLLVVIQTTATNQASATVTETDATTAFIVWNPTYKASHINDTSLAPNSVLTFSINVTNAKAITRYEMSLVFDPAILEARSVSFNNTIFGSNPLRYATTEPGEVFFTVYAGTAGSPFTGNGVLAWVEIRVISYGASGLDIDREKQSPDLPIRVVQGCFRNIEQRRVTPDFNTSPNPSFTETSEYMMGDVAVGIILPESTGPAYNWTDTEVNATIQGIQQAMDWWAFQEPRARLRHFYDIHTRVPTTYEPILVSEWQDSLWIGEVMSHLGYTQLNSIEQVRAYNNFIRDLYGTDWAFTIFVADSNGTNLGQFAGSGYAHAYFGGPWVTMSRHSGFAWNSVNYRVAVPAHETGHIFYAADEYNGVREYGGYLNAPDNDGMFGIMNQNNLRVSASTRRQLGWVDCDQNGILDILDTKPALRVDPFPTATNETSLTITGTSVDVPYPRGQQYWGRDISINRIVSVQYRLDNSPWLPTEPPDGAFNTGLEGFILTLGGLSEGPHELIIEAKNTVGNSASRALHFTVLPLPDTTPPIWPEDSLLISTLTSSTSVTLGWTPALDNREIQNYRISTGTTILEVVPGTVVSYIIEGLLPGADYTFTVEASDAAGHWTVGPSVRITTLREEEPPPADEFPPGEKSPTSQPVPEWWTQYPIIVIAILSVLIAVLVLVAKNRRSEKQTG